MPKLKIVACGLSLNTLTADARASIENADLLLGAERLIREFNLAGKETQVAYLPDQVQPILKKYPKQKIVLLVSGDSGFYSAAKKMTAALGEENVEVYPGISSLQYFFAQLKMPWQDVKLVSCHGRLTNLISAVRRNHKTFALTGNNVPELLEQLDYYEFNDCHIVLGENLGLPEERITLGTLSELMGKEYSSLTVMYIENPSPSRKTRAGIEDNAFIRGEVPMTKAEVRAVIMSKLQLEPDSICLDLGAGTGSVSIEMALQAHEGRVIAVDKNPEAIELIKANAKKFQVANVEAIEGDVLDTLSELDDLDRVFIGGGGPQLLPSLVDELWQKNPSVPIVASAIALESANALIEAFKSREANYEVIEVAVSRSQQIANLNLMMAENPIYVIKGSLS